MGIALSLSALGGTIFNPIIAEVIKRLGWRGGFVTEGLLIGIILVPLAISLKPTPDEQHPAYGHRQVDDNDSVTKLTGLSLKEAMKKPVFYALCLAMLGLQFVSGSVQHIAGHITNIGISPVIAATVVSGVMIGAALGKFSIGYLLDRFNMRFVLLVYTLFGVIGWAGLAGLHVSRLLIASALILGLGQGICLVALPYLIRQEFGQRAYSNILSIINMLGAFAMSLSVYLVGLIFDSTGSYDGGWLINIIAYVISFIALALTIQRNKTRA